MKLPRTGERWFKGSRIDKKKFKQFLLPLSKEDAHLKFSFPVKYLRNQWRAPFEVISRYISCDGRYSNVQLYHLRILMALKGLKLNLPYFLLHSLHKMAIMVQCTIGNQDHSIFHHGLIKMLVQYQLVIVGKTWDEFLKENDFGLTRFWPTYSPNTREK